MDREMVTLLCAANNDGHETTSRDEDRRNLCCCWCGRGLLTVTVVGTVGNWMFVRF